MQKNITTPTSYSKPWILLLALLTSLGPLSIDMYLPALPEMAMDLGVSTQMISNTLPAYFLGLALGQLIYGPVSDRIGRKKPLYFGLSLYVVASLMCYFTQNEWSLIAARTLQALGGCVGVVIARATIRDRLDVQSSAQAFSSMMIVMGIAPILAPTIGAWILGFFSWHSVFGFLAFMGCVCLFCVHFFFKESLPTSRRLELSFKQVLQLYATIYQDKRFLYPMLIGCFSGGILFCYISASASILMVDFAMSQQHFAYAFGFNAFGIMLLSTLNNVLANKTTVYGRLKLGLSIQSFGVLVLLLSAVFVQSLPLVMLGMFCAVSGIGLTGPNAMAFAMSHQGARAGTASAIMGSMQFACGLLGGVILNFLMWSAQLNMAVLMLGFVAVAFMAYRYMRIDQQQTAS